MGVGRQDIDAWIDERRALHRASGLPGGGTAERLLQAASAHFSPFGTRRRRTAPRRALDEIYAGNDTVFLDAAGFDWYDPSAGRSVRLPGHRTAGGRSWEPSRAIWDTVTEPAGLTGWCRSQERFTPHMPLWVVENGLATRVRRGRAFPRTDGWDRPQYLRAHLAAVADALAQGSPVTAYLHWSLVDNYEWGSFEPRFGIFGMDRDRGADGGRRVRWLDTDADGADSAGAYRRLIAGLRAGDPSVLRQAP